MPHPTTVFVRPAHGVRIADPQTGQYLPEKGLLVPRSGFWLRRLKDGDVTVAEPAISNAVNAGNPGATGVEVHNPEAEQAAPVAPGQAKGKKKE